MLLQPHDFLTLEEREILGKALGNEPLMGALAKVFRLDARDWEERLRQEAMASSPNTNKMIQYAALAQASTEIFGTIEKRAKQLVQK